MLKILPLCHIVKILKSILEWQLVIAKFIKLNQKKCETNWVRIFVFIYFMIKLIK